MNQKEEVKETQKKPSPPTLGFAVVADLLLWGALLLYAPTYFTVTSGWRFAFYIPGFILLLISFVGALIELGKIWKSEGLSYWGVSLVFLIPAVALFLAVERNIITGTLRTVAKIGFLILISIGGPLFFHGIPYFFWKDEVDIQSTGISPTSDQETQHKSRKLKTNLEVVANIVIALLALATAIVTLVEKILP